MIKSDYATVTFVELELEIPSRQSGEITTVEGLLRTSAERLGEAQDLRVEKSPEVRLSGGGGGGGGDGGGGGNGDVMCAPVVSGHPPWGSAAPAVYCGTSSIRHYYVQSYIYHTWLLFSSDVCAYVPSLETAILQRRARFLWFPQVGAKVAEVITKLTLMSAGVDGEFPFTMVVDDPSGNSFVENPSAPNKDTALKVETVPISTSFAVHVIPGSETTGLWMVLFWYARGDGKRVLTDGNLLYEIKFQLMFRLL